MGSSTNSAERRSARFWGMFILTLLVINLSMAAIAIGIAIGDPSFRPVPSYGENAVDWETRKQLQARSDALGWTVQVERDQDGNGVTVHLRDRTSQPVTGCQGVIRVYHFTRAGDVQEVGLTESSVEPGTYSAPLRVERNGRWQVWLDLTRSSDERFILDRDCEWY